MARSRHDPPGFAGIKQVRNEQLGGVIGFSKALMVSLVSALLLKRPGFMPAKV
ncbi:MAG: hypothetical protein J0M19_07990 [Sphingomonadales bacterium]|nr:hypothetical protein [Sphingomonadales bacterium]